jgi:hypothetical protein
MNDETPLEIAHKLAEGRRETDMQMQHLDTAEGRARLQELIQAVDRYYADLIRLVGETRLTHDEGEEIFRLVRA